MKARISWRRNSGWCVDFGTSRQCFDKLRIEATLDSEVDQARRAYFVGDIEIVDGNKIINATAKP